MRTLDRPGLEQVAAGIALQAYIPDSFATQQRITDWARRRVAAGGAPVTIRIVKGANMEMERVEASLRGWPLATVHRQARHRRQLPPHAARTACSRRISPPCGSASRRTICSRWPTAWCSPPRPGGSTACSSRCSKAWPTTSGGRSFELAGNLLLYAPACRQEDFINAIGYLIRRLDENTGPDNFLRHAFNLEVDSPEWQRLEQQFVDSFARIDDAERRTAPHAGSGAQESASRSERAGAVSTPTLELRRLRSSLSPTNPTPTGRCRRTATGPSRSSTAGSRATATSAADVPLVIAGEEISAGRDVRAVARSVAARRRRRQLPPGDRRRHRPRRRLRRADPDGWRRRTPRERTETLHPRRRRTRPPPAATCWAPCSPRAARLLTEGDPEVSEAIDFCRFYADCGARTSTRLPGLTAAGRGVVVVVSPWNFPLAIPCGGVAAALAGGQHGHPQAGVRHGAHRLPAVPSASGEPACRGRRCSSSPAAAARVGQQLVAPRRRRRRDPHRRHRDGARHARPQARRCTCSPRPAARTPRSSPRSPTATWRSRTCSTRRSATAGRSARPRRC